MGNGKGAKVAAAVEINDCVYAGVVYESDYLSMLDTLNEHDIDKQALMLIGTVGTLVDSGKEIKAKYGLYVFTAYILGLRATGLEPKPTIINSNSEQGRVEITKPRPIFTLDGEDFRIRIMH